MIEKLLGASPKESLKEGKDEQVNSENTKKTRNYDNLGSSELFFKKYFF